MAESDERGTALALVKGSSLVAIDSEGLEARLEAAGLERRSMLSGDQNVPVPDGVYYEKRQDKLVVWVPPDPARTYGHAAVVPIAIELRLVPTPEGTRLTVRPVTARSTKLAFLGGIAITLAATLPLVLSGTWWLVFVLIMPMFIVWFLLHQQVRVARERETAAWAAIASVVGSLPKPEPDALGPYRG